MMITLRSDTGKNYLLEEVKGKGIDEIMRQNAYV